MPFHRRTDRRAPPVDGQSLCVYADNNYGGAMRVFNVQAHCGDGDAPGTNCAPASSFRIDHLCDIGWGDRISSVANHSSVRIDFYRDGNEGGPSFFLAPGWEFDTVGLNNDSFSSVRSLDN